MYNELNTQPLWQNVMPFISAPICASRDSESPILTTTHMQFSAKMDLKTICASLVLMSVSKQYVADM